MAAPLRITLSVCPSSDGCLSAVGNAWGRNRGVAVSTRLTCRWRHRLAMLAGLLLVPPALRAADVPEAEGLSCQVVRQNLEQSLSLEVQFTNRTDADLSLAPGPRLAWYADAEASEAMIHTAKVQRVQNSVFIVPARGSRQALWLVGRAELDLLRCNPQLPTVAALWFYQFNPRPQFRCRLQGYVVAQAPLRTDCASTARP